MRHWRALGVLLGCLATPALAFDWSFGHAAPAAAVALSALPAEAGDTWQLIQHNGPFPFPRDGVVFGNHEHRLPERPRNYYHEYTVKTPGAHNRGARRIICGAPAECYYTGDHYQTFQRIEAAR